MRAVTTANVTSGCGMADGKETSQYGASCTGEITTVDETS